MKNRFRRWITLSLIAATAVPLSQLTAGGLVFRRKTNMERLACEIDTLEHALNDHGTVVAKAPDIWGEARLTRHRHEFEKRLVTEIDNFKETYNASIRASDQAFLGAALAIASATTSGGQADMTLLNNLSVGAATASTDATKAPIERTAPGTLFIKGTTYGFASEHPELEPTIRLDQLKRYLDHLHEIRRINEGDDVTDTPGYSLNLVRIPISVIPGDDTRKGHGAEVTVTATPHITEELLPSVYRQLVVNDLIDQWHVAVSLMAQAMATSPDGLVVPTATTPGATATPRTTTGRKRTGLVPYSGGIPTPASTPEPTPEPIPAPPDAPTPAPPPPRELPKDPLPPTEGRQQQGPPGGALLKPDRAAGPELTRVSAEIPTGLIRSLQAPALTAAGVQYTVQQEIQYSPAAKVAQASTEMGTKIQVALASAARRSRLPIPSSQFVEVFGRGVGSVAYEFYERNGHPAAGTAGPCSETPAPCGTSSRSSRLTPRDARAFLKDEIESAYDYLCAPENCHLWQSAPAILSALRTNDVHALMQLRKNVVKFRDYGANAASEFEEDWTNEPAADKPEIFIRQTPVTTLAWAILVHSTLLNEQLNQDVKQVAMDPNCGCQPGCYVFYGPDPDPMARQVFIDYVKCRWPVHVFALDPVSQEQNVIDTFSMRRELQLAFALSLAAGTTPARQPAIQNMERYARRIELDMETIALNRTAVAFAHGEDTFGWRFYPRVQTPGFDSNAEVVFRDLLWGGPSKDCLKKDWELEPGMRECTALVVMPSFINHIRFDIRGHYFKLKAPDKVKSDVQDNVQWSERIQCMNTAVDAVLCEQDRYLPGEAERLLKRAEQLSRKLPLQTVHARVPNENTFGGFEMFSSGMTDLAPELLGYYGEPGIDPTKQTELFLYGENFSIHGTHVIAGNRSCDFDLISRQVMRVTIPAGVQLEGADSVDVHVATPYGVTQHLDIPSVKSCPVSLGYILNGTDMPASYGYRVTDKVPVWVQTRVRRPHEFSISVPQNIRLPETAAISLEVRLHQDDATLLLATVSKDAVLDAERGAYVIADTQFREVHTAIQKAIVDGKLYDANGDLPTPLDLEVTATATPTGSASPSNRVAGVLHLTVTLPKVE